MSEQYWERDSAWHRKAANELIDVCNSATDDELDGPRSEYLQLAQVHATMAVAAALTERQENPDD